LLRGPGAKWERGDVQGRWIGLRSPPRIRLDSRIPQALFSVC
jgi:hypothetical protein